MALIDNILSYWKLDETSGTRLDATDTNNDLSDTNTVGYTASAVINNAAVFVEANQERLQISDASQTGLDLTGSYTIAGWIYINTANIPFISKYNGSGHRSWAFQVRGDRITMYQGVSSNSHNVSMTIGVGAWHHAVSTYDATSNRLYVDGSLVGTKTMSGNDDSDSPFWIGCDDGDAWSNANIDEVGIWTRALSLTEIQSLYNSGNGLAYPFASPGPANLKTYNTNAFANIKTINTNPIANVKTLNTNA